MDERRTGWLLILVLAGQLVFLATRVPGRGGKGTALESAGLRLLGPVARLVALVSESFSGSRESLALRGRLIDENRALRQEVLDLRLRLLRTADLGDEMARLGAAVEYAAPPAGRIRAADVVYVDRSSLLRTLVLYAGPSPVRVNQPVLSPEGLVGRVVVVAGPYAKVQLITDRAAAVGAMLLRNRRQGVVRGSARDPGFGLELDYLPLQADVRAGDRIVTAGIDGIYPRGIPVGTVDSVEPGGQLFHRIHLTPAVDFGTLDQVYLLEHEPVPDTVKEALPGVRRR
ncbi:MAG TPA: rod shape-determining protein MreC [Thermoanaerobaculia bacterium]|nr:rod shape-determining protein MreC [Thermoanaerobaculia bacterium]